MSSLRPKVTFLTPVYNGAAFLEKCVDSILAQTYANWEYVIVNNRSTDTTLDIARRYARADSRIRVEDNPRFVTAIENYNNAFAQVSSDSVYTKVVSADDWITPDCTAKLVALASAHPAIGIVNCYQQTSDGLINWKGLDPAVKVVGGRAICRAALMDQVHVFGAPSSMLYRSDIVRARSPHFFPHGHPHADTDACYEILKASDFGFVHEVLSFERVHPGQISADLRVFGAGDLAYLEAVLKYGDTYLEGKERQRRIHDLEDGYYRRLGRAVLKLKGPRYWRFHRAERRKIGMTLDVRRVGRACLIEILREAGNPAAVLSRFSRYVRSEARLTFPSRVARRRVRKLSGGLDHSRSGRLEPSEDAYMTD